MPNAGTSAGRISEGSAKLVISSGKFVAIIYIYFDPFTIVFLRLYVVYIYTLFPSHVSGKIIIIV